MFHDSEPQRYLMTSSDILWIYYMYYMKHLKNLLPLSTQELQDTFNRQLSIALINLNI